MGRGCASVPERLIGSAITSRLRLSAMSRSFDPKDKTLLAWLSSLFVTGRFFRPHARLSLSVALGGWAVAQQRIERRLAVALAADRSAVGPRAPTR
jgi:hypothetical protein